MYIYVASPYTDPDPLVRDDRYLQAMEYTAELIAEGKWAFSPIVHCHEMAQRHDFPGDVAFWMRFNCALMLPAKEIHVLKMDGWADSRGVKFEIEFARNCQKPITYISMP